MSRSVGSLLYSATRVVTLFSLTTRSPLPATLAVAGSFFWGEAAVCLLKGTRDNAQRQDECDDEFAFTIHPNGWNS